jgi:hypothetical protein
MMRREFAGVWTSLLVAICATPLAGCTRSALPGPTEETNASAPAEVTQRQGALTGNVTFTIQLPNTAGLANVGAAASNTLLVADRAQTTSPTTGFVTLVNTGTVQTEVGTDTKLGNIVSKSPIVIRDRSRVTGDVQSAGTVSLVNGATVSGVVRQNTPITPLQTFSWTVTFPTPGSAVNLEPDQSLVLAPGSYGDVTVKSRATLRLSPGTFFVNSFSIEPQATVVTDGGPVFLYIATSMNFKGAISAGAFDRNFLVGVVGSGTVFLETPFTGTIVAPNATIRFAPLNPGVYSGSFFGRGIDLQPANVISLKTSLAWGTLFPLPDPRPVDLHATVTCVSQQGGVSRAVFGYVNDGFEIQPLPLGPSNAFSPAPTGRGQPQRFLIGRHDGAFATVFSGSITWSLPGGSATANAQSPVCPTGAGGACTPACGGGESCIGGKCVALCGDGLCASDEGCDACLTDCACGAGQVCFHNGCANPIRCGKEWQCGSGSNFGVQVDCGACPGGATCFNHVCK